MYGSLSGFRTYATDRGNSAPLAAADDIATQALVRASDYIKFRYVAYLVSPYDDTLSVVEPATYEAAMVELSTPNFFSTTYTEGAQKTLIEAEGIKWKVIGGNASGHESAFPTLALVEAMFEPYVSKPSSNRRMIRTVG